MGRSWENTEEAASLTQLRNDGGLDQNCRGGGTWSDSGYVLQVEPPGIPFGSDLECTGNRSQDLPAE